MKNYHEVANSVGLTPETTERYIKFMRMRWPPSEEQLHIQNGSAREWALRFRDHKEWDYADLTSWILLTTLETMDLRRKSKRVY